MAVSNHTFALPQQLLEDVTSDDGGQPLRHDQHFRIIQDKGESHMAGAVDFVCIGQLTEKSQHSSR